MRRWLDMAGLRLRSLIKRDRMDQDLNRELQFHLERLTQEKMAGGMAQEEARRQAAAMLGGVAQVEEQCRDMRRVNLLESIWSDICYAFRTLGRSPGFTAVVVVTLVLSIGATSAIFSVVRGVLLRRLPYPEQDRIVRFFLSNAAYPKFPVNAFDFLDFRQRNRSFEQMAVMTHTDVQLSGMGQPQRLTGFRVSSGYFRVLGILPRLGREFEQRDELPGNGRSVILSDHLWRTRFNADPNVIGRKVRLDNVPFTVVGVMPAEMQHPGNEYRAVAYGDTVDVWSPFTFEGNPNQRGSHYIEGIGRLKRGVSPAAAEADMNAIMSQLAREHPDGDSGWRVLVIPLEREIVGPTERLLLVLLGAVALVLMIACANTANLLLARATVRRREIAVRLALGAARPRLVRQMLTESLVIATLGGAGGALVAIGGVKALLALLPASFPRAEDIHVDVTVFLFTFGVAVGAGILFGLVPALQSSRADVQQNLREGARSVTGSGRHLRLRNALVISEVSLACVLLTGAGLLLRSFVNMLRTDPGFRAEHVLTASVSLPQETYRNGLAVLGFCNRLVKKLDVLPAVRASGIGTDLPWTGYDDNIGGFHIEGRPERQNDDVHARYHVASPDYFRALGVPLIRGRFFTDADNVNARLVLIVNQAMAQRYWPGENVVGKRINFSSDHPKEKDWTTIVGVVADIKDSPQKLAAEPAFWWPIQQTPFGAMTWMITVRANTDPKLLARAVRESVRELDPTLAVADMRLMEDISDASMAGSRFMLFLVALFAGLAIVLAAIGTYGVISYSVSQRVHEFGMRVALGAKPWDVMRLVLSQSLRLSAAGVLIGIACSLALARVLQNFLYEVSPADPMTFGLMAAVTLALSVAACCVPAQRATRVDPAVALRAE